jgi:replicative DNA helicase
MVSGFTARSARSEMTDAETAVLAGVWAAGRLDILSALEERDFISPLHQWLLGTLKDMRAAGEPLDGVAINRWLRQPKLKRVCPEKDPHLAALEILTTFSPTTQVDYYFRCVRNDRLRRATQMLGDAIKQRDDDYPLDPAGNLRWAKEQAERLLSKAVSNPTE